MKKFFLFSMMALNSQTLQTLTCCLFLVCALPLHPVVLVLQPPQSWTHSHLAFATLPLPILSVTFLKLTASCRPSAPPSGLPKCLRFGHWLTLCTLNIHLLTYLLTYSPLHMPGVVCVHVCVCVFVRQVNLFCCVCSCQSVWSSVMFTYHQLKWCQICLFQLKFVTIESKLPCFCTTMQGSFPKRRSVGTKQWGSRISRWGDEMP